MGSPKQLLPWGNQTLIEDRIQNLLKTGNPVGVVLGANSNLILPLIEKLKVKIFINKDWEKGMGTSISTGIKKIIELFPSAKGVMITLIDQPLVTTDHLQNMFQQFQSGKKQIIVSQSSSGWQGVPTLFDKYYINVLVNLNGEEGARKVFRKYPNEIISVECNDQLEDMDTPESYQRMLEIWRKTNN